MDDINLEAKRLSASYEPALDLFSPSFDKLLGQFAGDFDRYRLDEVVVAAISPVVSVPLDKYGSSLTARAAPPLTRDLVPIGRSILADANVPSLASRSQGVTNGGGRYRRSSSTPRWH